jgi:hypothetical protein
MTELVHDSGELTRYSLDRRLQPRANGVSHRRIEKVVDDRRQRHESGEDWDESRIALGRVGEILNDNPELPWRSYAAWKTTSRYRSRSVRLSGTDSS